MEIKRGILQSFDSTDYLATVAMAGSLSVWLDAVPVSRAIAAGEMVAGRHVALLFFDASNPNDAVVCAVWTG
jgi:hypothetical protein